MVAVCREAAEPELWLLSQPLTAIAAAMPSPGSSNLCMTAATVRRQNEATVRAADRLRHLWDFYDLDATERRLRAQLEHESEDAGRAEVLTQLARVEGLRDNFDACDRLLEQAE